MEIGVSEEGLTVLKKIFNPIILITEDGQEITVCMRDNGFELTSKKTNPPGAPSLYYVENGDISFVEKVELGHEKQTIQEQFETYADKKGFCLDFIFMQSEGVPQNPYLEPDTKMAYEIWCESRKV